MTDARQEADLLRKQAVSLLNSVINTKVNIASEYISSVDETKNILQTYIDRIDIALRDGNPNDVLRACNASHQ